VSARPGPDVVDDFPQAIPVISRELDVIETYLGALLDHALGIPKSSK
jgi:Ethanolamine utilization protein EutJ (predicted chaperonin)